MKNKKLKVMIVILILTKPIAIACKYSVRDVGFADLGSEPYRLYFFTRDDQILSDRFDEIATLTFLDTNVIAEKIDPNLFPDHSAIKHTNDFPSLVLVDSDDREIVFDLPKNRDHFEKLLSSIVKSPIRKKIRKSQLEVHSFVVVVESDDLSTNRRAIEIANGSISEIRQNMKHLPKSAGDAPKLLKIPFDRRIDEKIFLWSFGVDQPNSADAYIFILFGRGRKIGPIFTVPGATQRQISQTLDLVGQDCECGLDRSYMQGRMMPHEWTAKDDSRAVDLLGFDPGNPIVIAEMQRIIARGKNSLIDQITSTQNLDADLFNYVEMEITSVTENSEPTETISYYRFVIIGFVFVIGSVVGIFLWRSRK